MSSERGYSLAEIMIALLVLFTLVTAGAAYSLPWMNRERMRSAAYQVQGAMQFARVQAVGRSRPSAFLVESTTGRMQVYDLNDPLNFTDDVLLQDSTLSSAITFDRPDSGSPITLASAGGSIYQAVFAANGGVSSGAGEVVLTSGSGWDRVTLFAAGGVRVDRWDGTAWIPGS
jgi:Tfp pilus assembly protein FimT